MSGVSNVSSLADDKRDRHYTSDEEEEDLDTTADIHEILKKLHIQEAYGLGRNPTNLHSVKAADNYFYRVFLETARYIRFVFWTWWGLTVTTLVGGLGPFDWFTMFFYAFGGTVVLFFVLVGCLILNSPILKATYWRWSNARAGGLGLVNNANPSLFQALTQAQVDAGKEQLSKKFNPKQNNERRRYYDLDTAKLLLQFSSIIYEHPNEAVRNALRIATDDNTSFYEDYSHELDDEKRKKFREALFEYDSIGSRGDGVIREFCRRIGVDFEPISELHNTSSACAAFFWDPKSNWIVVTFKGTQPIEFGEWLSNLNARMSHVGSHIPGFRKVHLGFKDRVFPEDPRMSGGTRPYDTISRGVRSLAGWLRANNGLPGKPRINVWVTGHSLGCSTGSLVYSRFLMREIEIGEQSDLRDAYLFAAPILSDRDSVEVFNAKMMENPKKPRTMWRFTSNGDIVATCLPELGNYNSISVSPNNGFAFAHLGTELRIRKGVSFLFASGNHLSRSTRIMTDSKFTQDEIQQQRTDRIEEGGLKELLRQTRGRWYQKLPLIGRFIAHGTVFYWDQLDNLDTNRQAIWTWN